MNSNMENMVLGVERDPVEEAPNATPLDETTEFIGVINRRHEDAARLEEESRAKAAIAKKEAEEMKAALAKKEEKMLADAYQKASMREHRNRILFCFFGILAMLLLTGASYALQYNGYIQFPWAIVITAVFSAVAAFFAGIVWEAAGK